MKFKKVVFGTGVYFENKHRNFVVDEEFFIEASPQFNGIILFHKKNKNKHFISMYNVAYAEVDDGFNGYTEAGQDRSDQDSLQSRSPKKAKKLQEN